MTKYVKSQEALPANLHIWDPQPTQTAITETKIMDFYPISSLDSSDTVSFVIPAIEKYMLDRVEILTDVRILAADGANPAADNSVSTAPHVTAALWRNMDVNIGGVSLTQSFDNSYGMFQFWETVIHNTEGCHDMLWQKEGLRLDSVTTKRDSENLIFYPAENVALVNGGGKKRAQRFALGATVSLISDLNVSIFKQDKLLPSNLEIHISMTKNYSEFILLSAADSTNKVSFDKVVLRCTFQKPVDMVVNLIEERLARDNAIYHADKSMLSTHTISEGAREFTIDNVFNGILPYCFLIGVQDRRAFGRDRTKNPFSLYPIFKVQLFINGQDHFPSPIERTQDEYAIMYDTFLRQTGYANNGDTMLQAHYQAYPAMMFDLTPDKTQNLQNLNLMRTGTARLTITLNADAPQNHVLMVLAWYEQIVEISKDRQVTLI